MKYSILVGLLLFSTLQAYSQDEKAKAVLNELSAKTKSYKSLSASFSYKLEDKVAGISQSQNGTLLMSGDQYLLKLGDHDVISDGKTRWTYSKEMNEVYVDAVDPSDDAALNPSKLFTIWESGFKQYHAGNATVGGKTVEVIKLVPVKPDDKTYHTIRMYVDTNRDELIQAEILGKEGDNYTYTVKEQKGNADVPPGAFAFNKANYPGVEVIDNR